MPVPVQITLLVAVLAGVLIALALMLRLWRPASWRVYFVGFLVVLVVTLAVAAATEFR